MATMRWRLDWQRKRCHQDTLRTWVAMGRDMEAIQTEKAGSPEQTNMLTRAGHKLAELIGDNLSTVMRKTAIE